MRESIAKGVYYHNASGRWVVKVREEGKIKSLAYFLTEAEAKQKLVDYYRKNPHSRMISRTSDKDRIIAYINSCDINTLKELLYLVKLRVDRELE